MNLYIQIENEQAVNHPAFEDNLLQAFGEIPISWQPFIRVERPILNVYQILNSDEPTYQKIDGVWTDFWSIREMTNEEKIIVQDFVKSNFNNREQAENWSSWTLDETTCEMIPPIPRPIADATKIAAGIMTFWCGAKNNWKDTPIKPIDDKQYKFDFFNWQWVEVTQG